MASAIIEVSVERGFDVLTPLPNLIQLTMDNEILASSVGLDNAVEAPQHEIQKLILWLLAGKLTVKFRKRIR